MDADFAGLYGIDPPKDPSSAKSRTGYIIFLGPWPLMWKSQLQTKPAYSTLEAEYSALSAAARTMITVKGLLKVITTKVNCTKDFKALMLHKGSILEDNNGAYTVAANRRITSRTKYFHTECHHFWSYIDDGTLEILRCATTEQLADFLTKGLALILFGKNCKGVL